MPEVSKFAPPRRRWWLPRYSLRTLFIVMTVVCLVGGYWLKGAVRQRNAVRRFNEGSAQIMYRGRAGDKVSLEPIIPVWLRPLSHLLGEEAFGDVRTVFLFEATNDDLRYLADLRTVEIVAIDGPRITDDGIRHLQACPKLHSLSLYGTAITGEGFSVLRTLPKFEVLKLH